MEQRYIARVVGVRPQIVETRTDYLVAVPRSRKAFLVTTNPMAEAVVGRGTVLTVVRKAREKDVPVFGGGRCIVYVFNDAWESEALVERVAQAVVESQLGGLVLQEGACSWLGRWLRAVWETFRRLIAARPVLEIPETRPADVRPVNAPIPAGSGEASEQAPVGTEPRDRAPV
jgi:hypothetical protein